MTDLDQQTLGRHDADIANLKSTIATMAEDVHAMRKAMDEMRGGWKVAIWISGIIGGAISLLASHFWSGK